MKTNPKHQYGSAGDEIPVDFNDFAGVGKHRVLCKDIELMKGYPFAVRPDVVYVDPPWGSALANGFRKKASLEMPQRTDYWNGFLPSLIRQCNASKGAVFCEQGRNWANRTMMLFEAAGYHITNVWQITYYKRDPAVLFRAVFHRNPDVGFDLDLNGMDDEHTPLAVLSRYPRGSIVYDPCTGRGGTAIAAHKQKCVFLGCELNPRRLAVTLKELAILTGRKPIKYVKK